MQDLSTIVWALAKLNVANRRLLDNIYNRILLDIPILSAKDISYQLWGFAALGFPLPAQVLASYWVSLCCMLHPAYLITLLPTEWARLLCSGADILLDKSVLHVLCMFPENPSDLWFKSGCLLKCLPCPFHWCFFGTKHCTKKYNTFFWYKTKKYYTFCKNRWSSFQQPPLELQMTPSATTLALDLSCSKAAASMQMLCPC